MSRSTGTHASSGWPSAVILSGGAQTPIGVSAAAAMAAARAGITRFREHPFIFDRQLDPVIASWASWLPHELAVPERLAALVAPAILEALEALRTGQRLAFSRPGVFLVLPPAQRPGVGRRAHELVERAVVEAVTEAVGRPALDVVAGDQAAGLVALAKASDAIARGRVDVAIVCGVDSYIGVDTIRWLEDEQRLHGLSNSWGIVPGEAAGVVVLLPYADRRATGITPVVSLRSSAVALEPNPEGTGRVCVGEGLTAAFKGALNTLREGELVDAVLCDLNGEAERADEFGFSLSRVSKVLRTPGDFYAPADRWGDVGAATGVLLVLAAVAGWRRNYAPGPNALVWASSGKDPARAAALLAGAEQPGMS